MNTPSHFVGTFYFVTTSSSLYRVIVTDLTSTPIVQKMAGEGEHPPVTGTFRKGNFVGICDQMVATFEIPGNNEKIPLPSLGTTSLLVHGKTSPPIGFFLERKDRCEECFERSKVGRISQPLNPCWSIETIATLRAIGMSHPRISIAREGPYRLPRHILDCLQPTPAA